MIGVGKSCHRLMGRLWRWMVLLGFCCVSMVASAQLALEITGGTVVKIGIALSDFAGESRLSEPLTPIIKADLEQSGLFAVNSVSIAPPRDARLPEPGRWQGVDALVTGAARQKSDGTIEVAFRLFDTVKQTQLVGRGYHLTPKEIRATAHRIADLIYESLTGEKGVFSTRLAYVVKTSSGYALQLADSDGHNVQWVVRSDQPLMSPTWSPDGGKVAYVSFEKKKPVVYVQTLADGRREVIANYKGSNSSPAWAPNGRELAVVLSKDGRQQIYLVDDRGGNLRRLTKSNGADTEPIFSPDGSMIYFTSDRGGSPQIYRVSVNGGEAQRVTFSGITMRVQPSVPMAGSWLM